MSHYGTLNDALAYHTARGNAAWLDEEVTDSQRTAALVRGSAALDGLYGSRFPGVKTGGRSQTLSWPRVERDGSLITDNEGNEIDDDEIPAEIVNAAYEFALRELTEPGSTQEDLARGGAIKSVGAGSARVEFMDSAPAETIFTAIDNMLSGLLKPKPSATIVGFAARA